MKKKLHVGCGTFGTIFAGYLSKDGRTWSSDKQDVTVEALMAVVQHIIKFGKPVVISKEDGTPEFRITIEELSN